MQIVYHASMPSREASRHNFRRAMFYQSLDRLGIEPRHVPLRPINGHNSRETWLQVFDLLALFRDEDVVFMTDSWDVFFLADLDEITAKFQSFNADIVLAAETNLFPADLAQYGPIPQGPTRWQYVNGGQSVFRVGAMRALLSDDDFWPIDSKIWCNQEAYNRRLILHPRDPGFSLDYDCKLFCPIYDNYKGPSVLDALEVREHDGRRRIYNRETGQYPCSVHGNGGRLQQAYSLWEQVRD